jgi:hypothetical protein
MMIGIAVWLNIMDDDVIVVYVYAVIVIYVYDIRNKKQLQMNECLDFLLFFYYGYTFW